MDSYLAIAEKVLRDVRQPLSAREILKIAYQSQLVPNELYGRTQHKTLQARLSTDVLKRRAKSDFYRTGPGRFFLRALQNESSIPLQYRREYVAPVRASQLGKFEVLTLAKSEYAVIERGTAFPRLRLSDFGRAQWRYRLLDDARKDPDILSFRLVALPRNGPFALLRSSAAQEKAGRLSVGIDDYIRLSDWSLFSDDEIGLLDGAARIVAQSLDLTIDAISDIQPMTTYEDTLVMYEEGDKGAADSLVVLVELDCANSAAVASAVNLHDHWRWQALESDAGDLSWLDQRSSKIVAAFGLSKSN